MSLLAVQGGATGTGTVTLLAPVTNTNRTLTLPDQTGTVQVSGAAISGTTGTFSGDLSFNSGYGSAAVAYGCRAWVNFNGTANTNLTGTYARTSPSTTLTVTATAHGLLVGSSVNLDFTTGTGLDGVYTVVTVADANTFTVTTVASTTTSGNVTLLRNTIRGSGNVSSVADRGTGAYTVNFITAMPDANYSISATADQAGGIDTTVGNHNVAATGGGSISTSSAPIYVIGPLGNSAAPTLTDAVTVSVQIFR